MGRLPSWVDCEEKGKILLRHFGKWSGNLGHGGHTKPRSIGRRELSRFPGPLLPNINKIRHHLLLVDTIDGPSTRSYHKPRLALPGSSWSFEIRQTNGALVWAGVAENFQPGLMSQALRLRFFDRGPWKAPTRRPLGGETGDCQSSTPRHEFHMQSTSASGAWE